MTDSVGAFGSTRRAGSADDDSSEDDDASGACGVWPGSGGGSVIDSASCGTSGRGDIDI